MRSVNRNLNSSIQYILIYIRYVGTPFRRGLLLDDFEFNNAGIYSTNYLFYLFSKWNLSIQVGLISFGACCHSFKLPLSFVLLIGNQSLLSEKY